MDRLPEDLNRTALFSGIEPGEIGGLLRCLGAKYVRCAKGDVIVEEGAPVSCLGVLLSGRARAVKWDPGGRPVLISLLQRGSETGAMLAAANGRESPVTVEALEDALILQIPFERLLARCPEDCPRHGRLLRNYIGVIADKGLLLHERLDCLLRPTVREKVLAFLRRECRGQPGRTFTIPMDRGAMAEYLNVERSALSRELSCMKRDGLIDYHKNSFRLF